MFRPAGMMPMPMVPHEAGNDRVGGRYLNMDLKSAVVDDMGQKGVVSKIYPRHHKIRLNLGAHHSLCMRTHCPCPCSLLVLDTLLGTDVQDPRLWHDIVVVDETLTPFSEQSRAPLLSLLNSRHFGNLRLPIDQ